MRNGTSSGLLLFVKVGMVSVSSMVPPPATLFPFLRFSMTPSAVSMPNFLNLHSERAQNITQPIANKGTHATAIEMAVTLLNWYGFKWKTSITLPIITAKTMSQFGQYQI